MAMPYDCEAILATIEWAYSTAGEHDRASGYGMDRLIPEKVQGARSSAKSRPGRYARYLRGDNVPRWEAQAGLIGNDLHVNHLGLPLYRVLRIGLEGYRTDDGADRVQAALDDLQGRFERRITRYEGPGLTVVAAAPTRRFALEICAYGSCHAVTVLLAAAMELQRESDWNRLEGVAEADTEAGGMTALLMGQRAFQCLILAIAAEEFPVTAPLVVARVRQRVLDGLQVSGKVLDTAAVDVPSAVAMAREALDQARSAGTSRFQQRAHLRAWLTRADSNAAQLIPPIATPEEAERSRHSRPVMLEIQPPEGAQQRTRSVGKRAREKLLPAMAGYVAFASPETPRSDPLDGSGPRYIPDGTQPPPTGPTATL